MLTTVQDLGRPGHGPLGVSASGAADPLSLRLGNRLVGNPPNAAALELTMLGGTFHFPGGATIAIAGGDFGASVPLWTPTTLPPNTTIRLGPARTGARAYLCVRGGIDVPLFLDSASTHLLTGLGGFHGRALRKGDVLNIGIQPSTPLAHLPQELISLAQPRHTLRVTAGPQPEIQELYDTPWRVSEQSNRMGIRLTGPPLDTSRHGEMITEGVSLGAIQIPAGGQPIILFVEQQTTGGYPKIANVISADLHSLGQLRPRDEIRFQLVSPAAAREFFIQQERLLAEALA